jgi:hypothetical protein
MAVVFHQTGTPRKTTTAQKEAMTARRSQALCVVSGGGCLRSSFPLLLMVAVFSGGRAVCAMLSWGVRALTWVFRGFAPLHAVTCHAHVRGSSWDQGCPRRLFLRQAWPACSWGLSLYSCRYEVGMI